VSAIAKQLSLARASALLMKHKHAMTGVKYKYVPRVQKTSMNAIAIRGD